MDAELNKAIRTNPPINTIIDLLEIYFKLCYPRNICTVSEDELQIKTNFRHVTKSYRLDGDNLTVWRVNANKDALKITSECMPIMTATKIAYVKIIKYLYGPGAK